MKWFVLLFLLSSCATKSINTIYIYKGSDLVAEMPADEWLQFLKTHVDAVNIANACLNSSDL